MQVDSKQRIDILFEELEKAHIKGDVEELRDLISKLQEMLHRKANKKCKIAIDFYNGIIDFKNENFSGAHDYMKKVLKYGNSEEFPYFCMRANNLLGIISSEKSDFHAGLTYYLEAYKISEKNLQLQYGTIIYNNIGSIFSWLDEKEVAIDFLKRAYQLYFEEQQDDQVLISNIITNLIELNFMKSNSSGTDEWSKKGEKFFSKEDKACVECYRSAQKVVEAAKEKNEEELLNYIEVFFRYMRRLDEYLCTFRCGLKVLEITINKGLQSSADTLLEQMDKLNENSSITSFNYEFSQLKASYYEKFIRQKDSIAAYYLKDCAKEANNVVFQLRKAYARSLLAEIELGQSKEENRLAKELADSLQRNMERDPFTGLLNKVSTEKYIIESLSTKISITKQAMLIIDIDKFKNINDTFGHIAGDEIIKKIAAVIKEQDRGKEIIGRFGGDEFVVFIKEINDEKEVEQFAQQLLGNVRKLHLPNKQENGITLSIGACIVKGNHLFENVFEEADKALYLAKKQGRNRVCFADE